MYKTLYIRLQEGIPEGANRDEQGPKDRKRKALRCRPDFRPHIE